VRMVIAVKKQGSTLLHVVDKFMRAILDILSTTSDDKGLADLAGALKSRKPSLLHEIGEDLTVLTMEAQHSKILVAKMLLEEQAKALASTGYRVVVMEARLRGRGLVGAGSGPLAAVFEVGLAWDLLLDLPYVPGSSFKGAVSAFAEALAGCSRAESRCSKDELNALRPLFGDITRRRGTCSEATVGALLFLDAYPVAPGHRGALVVPAVITPHYHRGGELVRYEYEAQPVPVQHIVLAPGTVFRFIAAFPDDKADDVACALTSLGINASNYSAEIGVAALVTLALASGIGARTTKGYGVFELTAARTIKPPHGSQR